MRAFCSDGRYQASFVILTYFLLTVLITWPLAFRLDSSLFGDYGDSRGTVWGIWAKISSLLDGAINHLVAAPFGVIADRGFSQPVTEWLYAILARLFSEIVAYNLYVLLAFPLTAIATYFLLDRLLHNKTAAFVGGLVFGFCPAAVMQAVGGHASYAFNAFIPVFLMALLYNRVQRTPLSAFYVGACFALIALTALYIGYFAIYVAIYFFVFDILSCNAKNRPAIFRNYFYAAIFAVALILPFEYNEIYRQIISGANTLKTAGHIRNFGDLNTYSSRYWEFLIPSIDHPFLGDFTQYFVQTHLHGSNTYEQTLYLGLVPVGLLLAGIIFIARGKLETEHRTYFLFFAFGALWMYFLSLPPLISIGSISVPTVSYFAYKIAPMFRVYARFGILVNFFVACAIAVVLTHLYQRMPRARYYALLAVLLPLLVFEYWSVPPNYALAVDRPPEVYQWLAKEPGDVIIAEYPMTTNDEFAFYTYLFWQRIHNKKLVNGAARDNAAAWDFFEKVKNLDDAQTPVLLKSVGVKYIIVHTEMYQEGLIPKPIKRYFTATASGMHYNGGKVPSIPYTAKFYRAFGTDMVFSLEKVPTKSVPKTAYLPTERPS